MELELARRSHAIFMRAIDLSAAERAALIDAECSRDPALRAHVLALLAAMDRSGEMLETPSIVDRARFSGAAHRDHPESIRDYRIVRIIGVGGMATVYEAIQDQPRRHVALKVLRHGLAQTSAIQRFQFETEVLARLQHPGIAQIYEAGAYADGHGFSMPFFAMEYIADALPITAYAEKARLSLRQRLELFVGVCDAVHHGHQHGVIHRDLKPGNVLVDGHGRPRVIDFGVARLSDPNAATITRDTNAGQLIGTLNYMSPEQCTAGNDVDIRADVYSLGVMLYELVCGRLPHDLSRATVPEALQIVREEAPPPPSAIDSHLRGDIDAIVLHAIEKSPSRRYAGVAALAADIRRHLANEPILARPATALYQIGKFARRHRTLVTSAALIGAIAIGAGAWSTWAMLRWRFEAHRAQRANDQALVVKRFLEEIIASTDPRTGYADIRLVDVLRDASAQVSERFSEHPEVEADLRFMLSQAFDNLGLFDEALVHAQPAAELYERLLGRDAPRAIKAALNYGWLLFRARKLPAADAVAADVVARIAGIDDVETQVAAQRLLASIALAKLEFDESERILRAALDAARKSLGPTSGETLLVINDLSGTLSSRVMHHRSADPTRDIQEAIDLLRGALDSFVARFGEDGRHTLLANLNLARWFELQRRFAEAEPYAQRILDLTPRRFGTDHVFRIEALRVLGECRWAQRQFADAARWTIQHIEAIERRAGGKHTAMSLAAMSDALAILDAAGELATAEAYSRTLFEKFGGESPHISGLALGYGVTLARVLSRQNRHTEAEAIFATALEDDAANSEDLRWQMNLCYGAHCAATGKYDEAERRLEAARAELSADDKWRIVAELDLARMYQAMGDASKAEQWMSIAMQPEALSELAK